MKSVIIITYSIILLSFGIALGQSTKRYKMLRYYYWGTPNFCHYESTCIAGLEKRYGLIYVKKAGCEVKRRKMKKWKRHNVKINDIMEARHGKDWRDKYNNERGRCSNDCFQ